MSNKPPSAEQVAAFHEQGWAILPGFADAAALAELREQMGKLLGAFEPSDHPSLFHANNGASSDAYFLESGNQIRFFLEPDAVDAKGQLTVAREQSVNKAGHALHTLDPVFRRFCASSHLKQVAAAFGQREPRALQSMYLFKQPRIGADVALHQDATFLYTDPVSVLGLWLALDDADESNGCLWALPGGHRLGLKRRLRRDGAASTRMEILDPTPFPERGLTPLPVTAGSLVVLHGLLPHLSRPNRSGRPRHAFSVHYIDEACRYPEDNWLRPTG